MVRDQGYNTWRLAVGERVVVAWKRSTGELAHFTRERLPDGIYRLARSGAIDVRGGRIVGTLAPACSSAWSVARGPGGVVLTRGSRAPDSARYSGFGDVGRTQPAVLDLADGALLIVVGDGVGRMVANPGAASGAAFNGNPTYELAEDFAP